MARDAKPHPINLVHLEDLRHTLHVTVAGGAGIGAHGIDMTLMGEVGVTGEVMYPHPFDRFLLAPGLTQLSDFRLVRAVAPTNHQVASHAGLHRRDAGLGRDCHRVVAILALDLVLAGVNVVPEENGLPRTWEVSGIGDDHRPEGIRRRGLLLRTGSRIGKREERGYTTGRDATDDECQLTHHHLTAEVDPGLGSGRRAPKYSPRILLHNPTFSNIPTVSVGFILHADVSAVEPRRSSGRGPLGKPLGLTSSETEERID
jgi:hypothetical protein